MRAPHGAKRCVLFVPPFGEEMNKCRRQVTETAERLVAVGYATLIVDLFGTGDSEGEFADASTEAWQSDIGAALAWARADGLPVAAVVATRLGCALAADYLAKAGERLQASVFWQPVSSGRQFMTQFLRLRVAASLMDGETKESVETLRNRLQEGETLEVAGYAVSPRLVEGVERLDLAAALNGALGELGIFEVGSARSTSLSPAGRQLTNKAGDSGIRVTTERLVGEPFWNSTEIVVNRDLTAHTVDFLQGRIPA